MNSLKKPLQRTKPQGDISQAMTQMVLKIAVLAFILGSASGSLAARSKRSPAQRKSPAFQQANPEATNKARENAAKKACSTGDYKTGVEILADLFVETNNPVLVHNQARCYQQNGQFDLAIFRFQEYLRKATEISDTDRALVNSYINECESEIAKNKSPEKSAPVNTQPIIVDAPPIQGGDIYQPASPGKERRSTLRSFGLGTMVIGAIVLGTACGINVYYNNQEEVTDSNASKLATLKKTATIGYIGGGALVATGLVLYFAGGSSSSDSATSATADSTISFLPAISPTETALFMRGTF